MARSRIEKFFISFFRHVVKPWFAIIPLLATAINGVNIILVFTYAHKSVEEDNVHRKLFMWATVALCIYVLSLRHRLLYFTTWVFEEKRLKLRNSQMLLAAYIPVIGSQILLQDLIRGELLILTLPLAAIGYCLLSLSCFFVYMFSCPKSVSKTIDYPVVGENSIRPAAPAALRVVHICQVVTETVPLTGMWLLLLFTYTGNAADWMMPHVIIIINMFSLFQHLLESWVVGLSFTPVAGYSHSKARVYDNMNIVAFHYDALYDADSDDSDFEQQKPLLSTRRPQIFAPIPSSSSSLSSLN